MYERLNVQDGLGHMETIVEGSCWWDGVLVMGELVRCGTGLFEEDVRPRPSLQLRDKGGWGAGNPAHLSRGP